MSDNINSIVNIDELLEQLKKTLNGNNSDVDLSTFYKYEVKITGDSYNGEISSSLCYSLINFHENIMRLYALSTKQNENLKYLTSDDKNLLNITFVVKDGCTEWKVDLTKIFTNIGKQAVDKLSEKGLVFCFSLAVLGLLGYNFTDDYFNAEIQMQDRELSAKLEIEENDSRNEQQVAQSQAMIDLAKILVTKGKEFHIDHIKTYDSPSSLKFSTNSIEVSQLNKAEIESLTKQKRRQATQKNQTRPIRIVGIREDKDKLIVTGSVSDDYTFPIHIDTTFIEEEETSLLFDAFKKHEIIYIKAEYKSFNNKIEKAIASNIYKENKSNCI